MVSWNLNTTDSSRQPKFRREKLESCAVYVCCHRSAPDLDQTQARPRPDPFESQVLFRHALTSHINPSAGTVTPVCIECCRMNVLKISRSIKFKQGILESSIVDECILCNSPAEALTPAAVSSIQQLISEFRGLTHINSGETSSVGGCRNNRA